MLSRFARALLALFGWRVEFDEQWAQQPQEAESGDGARDDRAAAGARDARVAAGATDGAAADSDSERVAIQRGA